MKETPYFIPKVGKPTREGAKKMREEFNAAINAADQTHAREMAERGGLVETSDAHRLEWVSKNWGGQRADYASHVLNRGGTGDLSDIRSFIDAQTKA
jgi:hypothetical protein